MGDVGVAVERLAVERLGLRVRTGELAVMEKHLPAAGAEDGVARRLKIAADDHGQQRQFDGRGRRRIEQGVPAFDFPGLREA